MRRNIQLLIALVLCLVSTLAAVPGRAEPIPARRLVAPQNRERGVAGNGGSGSLEQQRVGVAFGRPPSGDLYRDASARRAVVGAVPGGAGGASGKRGESAKDAPAATDGAANYLITLERTVTNDVKDKILDILLRSGAVVKQTYDYRVFKGILFTVPQNNDKGLTAWQSSLGKQDGVKYVEEDSVVRIQ